MQNTAEATREADLPKAIQFAIIGDFGDDSPGEAAVSRLVHSWKPEFIVTTGDNNYPAGEQRTIDKNIAKHYADYIAFNPNYKGAYRAQGATTNRFFPTLGNHDWRTIDLQPYFDMFQLPGNQRYYTFSRGPVDFFILDSDPHEPDGVDAHSVQAQWLQRALSASRAAFKIVVMHHPPYSSGYHGPSLWMQWPFADWGASVILSGHDHSYEHFVANGIPYIVNGLGGAEIGTFTQLLDDPNIRLEASFNQTHGAIHAHADSKHLTLDFFSVENKHIDSITLNP